MKIILLFTILISSNLVFGQKTYKYFPASKDDTRDSYFGDTISDPYQWMENSSDPRLDEWLKKQKSFTNKRSKKNAKYWEMRSALGSMYNGTRRYDRDSSDELDTKKKKEFILDYKFKNSAKSPDIRYRKYGESNYHILLYANDFKENKSDNLNYSYSINEEKDLVLIRISINGSDWQTGYLFDLNLNKQLPDTIKNLRVGSTIQWHTNSIYYDSYDQPEKGRELLDKSKGQKLYQLKLETGSTPRSLYINPDVEGTNSFSFSIKDDNLLLNHFIKSRGTYYRAISCADLSLDQFFPKNFLIYPKEKNNKLDVSVIKNDSVWLLTNWNAPNGKVLLANLNKPNSITEFVPEYDVILKSVNRLGEGKIVCTYFNHGSDLVLIFNDQGKLLKKIDFPKGKKLNGFFEEDDVPTTEFYITSFYHPDLRYKISLNDLTFKPIEELTVPYDPDELETRYVSYPSKDGTLIPMYITCKKNIKLNGENPVLISGYGGYGITVDPSFSHSSALFLLYGGILATPSIRGGGAQGNDWALAGRRLNKQNGIDDFIAAAEYLIGENYSRPEKIAIEGGSHGAMIVGAAMTQRPELFQAVIAEAGPMDMLRFNRFTIGSVSTNINEFGIPTNIEDYENIASYSPLNQIKKGIKYPNTLLITGDTDGRVPPLHSYKFLAALQEMGDPSSLYSIYITEGAGHGGALTGEDWLDAELFKYYFLFDQLSVGFF